MSGRALRAAFPRTLPIMAGYLFLGLAWGILLRDKGVGVEWAIMISGLVYAGSMQFVLVGLLTTAFSPITTLFMMLIVPKESREYPISTSGTVSTLLFVISIPYPTICELQDFVLISEPFVILIFPMVSRAHTASVISSVDFSVEIPPRP